jgi:hypothetical protein
VAESTNEQERRSFSHDQREHHLTRATSHSPEEYQRS